MSSRAFTEQQEREILQMRAIGIPTGDIVREHGGRRNAIYALFHRAGVPLGPNGPTSRLPTPREREQALALWREGHSLTAVARELRRSPDWARRALQLEGVQIEPRRPTVQRRPQLNWAGYVTRGIPPDHPFASMRSRNGKVMEHRLVMAEALGRPLAATETVHHIDGDRSNNRIDNLQLRQGAHGNGYVLACRSCGSTDLEPQPLGEQS